MDPSPTEKGMELNQFVATNHRDELCIRLRMEDLAKLNGTESYKPVEDDPRKVIFSWDYHGNGKHLGKFLTIVANQPVVSDTVWIHITGQVINEESEIPHLPELSEMYLYIRCQLHQISVDNLTSAFSALKPKLSSDLWCFEIQSDGYRIPGLGNLFQHIPPSVDNLGFINVGFSSSDAVAIAEKAAQISISDISLGPTDSTVDSFLYLVQKLKTCGSIVHLHMEEINLSPENEKRFLGEFRNWTQLKWLTLLGGKLGEEGQKELESLIKSLPKLKEVEIWSKKLFDQKSRVWPKWFTLPNEHSLESCCRKKKVRFARN